MNDVNLFCCPWRFVITVFYCNYNYICTLIDFNQAWLLICISASISIPSYGVYYFVGFCAEFNEEGRKVQGNNYLECTKYSPPCPRSYKSSNTYVCKYISTSILFYVKCTFEKCNDVYVFLNIHCNNRLFDLPSWLITCKSKSAILYRRFIVNVCRVFKTFAD